MKLERIPGRCSSVLAVFTTVLLTGVPARAGDTPTTNDWANWRGPNYDGSTEATGLPTSFSRTQGVKWAADLLGPAASTPVILGDRVFLTSVDLESETLLAMCLDRNTGEERWFSVAGSGYQPAGQGSKLAMHPRSNYASPSPVTDGSCVVFFFGNGDLVTYDLDGERLWSRNLQEDYGDFCFQWTFSSSPALIEGKIYLQILQRNQPAKRGIGKAGEPSYLLAIDPDTGDTLWKHERPSSAQMESLESYATPIPYVGADGRKELVVVGGDVITGHDPETGEELWRWGTWNEDHRQQWWRLVPTAVIGEGVALVCAPKNEPVYAVRLGGSGTLDAKALEWQSEDRSPVTSDVPTPLFYRGAFYVLSDMKESLSKLDPATGEVEWTVKMPGDHKWRASPTGADGKIWCMNHGGLVVIVDPSGEIVSQVEMGEEDADNIRSAIAVAHGCLFIRTNSKLYCVGE